MNNFFSSGRYSQKLTESYSYDKKKKELLDARRKKENNTKERCAEKKATIEL